METWQNTAQSQHVINVKNDDGSDGRLVVTGGRSFTIAEEDRVRYSKAVIAANLNPFENGAFVPVVDVIETAEDADAIEDNPHHMTDTEFRELLVGNGNTFNSQLRKLTAEPALRRLYALADSDDVSPKRVTAIRERLNSLGFETAQKSRVVGTVNTEQYDPNA